MELNEKVYPLIPKGKRKKYQYTQLQTAERRPGQPQSRNKCYFTAKEQALTNTDGPQTLHKPNTLPRKRLRQEKPSTDFIFSGNGTNSVNFRIKEKS